MRGRVRLGVRITSDEGIRPTPAAPYPPCITRRAWPMFFPRRAGCAGRLLSIRTATRPTERTLSAVHNPLSATPLDDPIRPCIGTKRQRARGAGMVGRLRIGRQSRPYEKSSYPPRITHDGGALSCPYPPCITPSNRLNPATYPPCITPQPQPMEATGAISSWLSNSPTDEMEGLAERGFRAEGG